MTSYLLLRNNKESGPFSFDDLLGQGLKPYDLVWVTGKSAAWRYPSEVEELRAYAAEVEEQPFDRFFKKTSEQKVAEAKPVTVAAATADEHIAYQPKTTETTVARKSVFVTLPAQPAVQTSRPVTTKPVAEPRPVVMKEEPAEEMQVKYAQPLDEIKEMYVKTLKDRKSRLARRSFWMKHLRVAAVVAALIGIGGIAGFLLRPGATKQAASVIDSQPLLPVVTEKAELANDKPAATATPSTDAFHEAQPQTTVPAPPPRVFREDDRTAAARLNATTSTHELLSPNRPEKNIIDNTPPARKTAEKKQADPQAAFVSSERDPVTGERSRTTRGNNPVAINDNGNAVSSNKSTASGDLKQYNRPTEGNKLEKLVTVSSNDYKRVAFGGIRNLELTVTNRSKYALDNVIVELEYLKPNEEPLRTENIRFKAIAANESATIRIPDTNRGIKVSYRILTIGSRAFNADIADN